MPPFSPLLLSLSLSFSTDSVRQRNNNNVLASSPRKRKHFTRSSVMNENVKFLKQEILSIHIHSVYIYICVCVCVCIFCMSMYCMQMCVYVCIYVCMCNVCVYVYKCYYYLLYYYLIYYRTFQRFMRRSSFHGRVIPVTLMMYVCVYVCVCVCERGDTLYVFMCISDVGIYTLCGVCVCVCVRGGVICESFAISFSDDRGSTCTRNQRLLCKEKVGLGYYCTHTLIFLSLSFSSHSQKSCRSFE